MDARELKQFIDAIAELPLPPLTAPAHPPRQPKLADTEIAVLHVSDVQYGKVTDTYNSGVACNRLADLANRTARIIESRKGIARIDELRLYLGGDIVEGQSIFKGQPFLIDQPVYHQAVHGASTAIARMILRLLQVVDKIHVLGVRGNHGRDAEESPGNWDHVCYEITKHKLLGGQELFPERRKLNPRLTFAPIGKWYHVDRVFNWGNLVVHGDQFRGQFGGANFAKKYAGWIDSIPEPWDYIYFGHFHQFGSGVYNRRVWLANGTTESDNDYAQELFAATGAPMQRLAFYDKRHGLIADYPVYLEDRKANIK
jgi:hypothetical protein